jgi:hypothetical protein
MDDLLRAELRYLLELAHRANVSEPLEDTAPIVKRIEERLLYLLDVSADTTPATHEHYAAERKADQQNADEGEG